ncbi:hypothetical protein M5K25_020477 [Dendrobium thyrsiflorum]|uniref:BED-type domain-containing protein n=1 Tax=Dendrobium thyrsiflorum TaxID=117978 RepID=A0ABD0UA27_DENTH
MDTEWIPSSTEGYRAVPRSNPARGQRPLGPPTYLQILSWIFTKSYYNSEFKSIMSSSAGGSGSKEPSVETDKPLWLHVTKLGKTFEGGGNVSFKCNYCGGTYKGSYSRVKAHLLKIAGHGIKMCPKITTSQLIEMQRQVDEAESRIIFYVIS